jgi:4-amino-4-deoxy-L-arabinose transferase-like glycosyltransferase
MFKKLLPIILILLLALALRTYQLTEIPPGLTHDEANHGREAIEILDGVLRYYFPLNYGSEPLYSYTVAGLMALIGEGLFALRLVNVIFGLATIAVTYIWSKQAFDKTIALVAALLMAISFWPLASSREALRAGMLPFFMTLALWFFWRIIFGDLRGESAATEQSVESVSKKRTLLLVLGFALSILATLHIYLAARVSWLLFPAFLLYLTLTHKPIFQRSWKPVIAGLLLAGLLSIPMFVYLANNPQSQTRLSMLGSTLQQVREGNVLPVVQNSAEALLAFVWPGYGDQFLAYNIPGRPVFDLITAVFFVTGLLISIRRWKQPPYFFVLLWFLIGIIPSLITGSTANTTRNLAALPAVYLLPAIGFITLTRMIAWRLALSERAVILIGSAVWLTFAGVLVVRDYFFIWGQSATVRGAYQHTLVEELNYLQEKGLRNQPVTISTVYPGPAHDPSIALVLWGTDADQLRWIDARYAMLLPTGSPAQVIIPDSTPYHPAFTEYLQPLERIALRADDLDPGFTVYFLQGADNLLSPVTSPLADFGGAIQLLDAKWLSPQVNPGETAELLTIWRVMDPQRIGPVHSPTSTTDVVFFTHLMDLENQIMVQRDALEAPAWSWKTDDILLQVHPLTIPETVEPGVLPAYVGIYDRPTGVRVPLLGIDEAVDGDFIEISPLQVAQSGRSEQN